MTFIFAMLVYSFYRNKLFFSDQNLNLRFLSSVIKKAILPLCFKLNLLSAAIYNKSRQQDSSKQYSMIVKLGQKLGKSVTWSLPVSYFHMESASVEHLHLVC